MRGEYGRVGGGSERGDYRRVQVGAWGSNVLVGDGTLLPRTPGDVEAELNQFHGEVMQFGQELIEQLYLTIDQSRAVAVARAQEELGAALHELNVALPTAVKARIDAARLRVSNAQSDLTRASSGDIVRFARPNAPQALTFWYSGVWLPWFANWSAYYHELKDIPMQMWPGSGAWDRIQDYRGVLIKLRDAARSIGFQVHGIDPIQPRKDPSLSTAITDVGKIAKWGLIGLLAIGGVVVVSTVAQDVRSDRAPLDRYMALAKRARGAR